MKDLNKGKRGKNKKKKKITKLSPEIDAREIVANTWNGIGDWWESEGGR